MNARTNACTFLTLITLFATPLAAQTEPRIPPGTRVRITAPELPESLFVGQVVSIDSERLELEGIDTRAGVELNDLTRLEISGGLGNRAGIGAIAGAVAGVAVVAAWDDPEADAQFLDTRGLIVPAGALFGAVVGLMIRYESWEEVPLPIVVDPTGRVGFSMPLGRR